MAGVQIRDLCHVYKAGRRRVSAVDHVSLDVPEGRFFTLLGPSGCGKTTTLRCIAGLERPTSGEIRLDDVVVVSGRRFVPTHRRDIGMVFQDYAVWPHMTVFENVAFPLRVAHVRSSEVRERVTRVLEAMEMEDLAPRRATQLSGGQQQRLALARALVREPKVLLLDEPLSNLDARLREQMRAELRLTQRRLKVTTVFVTHDQLEALSMSHRIAVMYEGKVVQEGTPREIYAHPANEFVASFIGTTTFVRGCVESIDRAVADDTYAVLTCGLGQLKCRAPATVREGQDATVAVRPESIVLHRRHPGLSDNVYEGQVQLSLFLGEMMDYRVEIGSELFRAMGPTKDSFRRREKAFVELPPTDCILLPGSEQPETTPTTVG